VSGQGAPPARGVAGVRCHACAANPGSGTWCSIGGTSAADPAVEQDRHRPWRADEWGHAVGPTFEDTTMHGAHWSSYPQDLTIGHAPLVRFDAAGTLVRWSAPLLDGHAAR